MQSQGGQVFFHSWRPALREQADDVRFAWTNAVARTLDTIQNSGWIAGGVDQAVAMCVGTGLRLTSKPDGDSLGWTQETAAEWARLVERRWEIWADNADECDIEGKSNVGKMTAQAMRTHFCYGEILASVPYLRRPWNQYGTKIQMLPPHRLAQDTDNTQRLYQGVWRDQYGYPIGYRISDAAYQVPQRVFRDVPARDAVGRKNIIHVFDGFPGQARGIPPITPALKVVRQFEQLADATLTTALIQAIFAATIESPSPTQDVVSIFQDMTEQAVPQSGTATTPFQAMLDTMAGWYDSTQIDLGRHGKIAHLAPGDKLDFKTSNHPNAQYEAFSKFLLREIARCLGITFEQLTGDYTGATYSSVRMATSEQWILTLYRRAHLLGPFLQPIYEAWLEEEIELGLVPFPGGVDGFIANRGASTRCHWRGPAKPQADDARFAEACATLKQMGVITDEWICAELGDDWEDTYEQRAREMQARAKLGLPEPTAISAAPKLSGQQASQPGQPGQQALTQGEGGSYGQQ